MEQPINPPKNGRYVRFNPRSWHGHISMRVEVYGCRAGKVWIDWLTDSLTHSLTRSLTDFLTHWPICWLSNWITNRLTGWHWDSIPLWLNDSSTDTPTNWTDSMTDWLTHSLIHCLTSWLIDLLCVRLSGDFPSSRPCCHQTWPRLCKDCTSLLLQHQGTKKQSNNSPCTLDCEQESYQGRNCSRKLCWTLRKHIWI